VDLRADVIVTTARKPAPVVDVDLDAEDGVDAPSFTFRVGGQEFRVRSKEDVHWGTVEKWMAERNESGSVSGNLDELFTALLFPEDIDAFMVVKNDPRGALTNKRMLRLLDEITKRVFGVAGSANPTQRPSSSAGGPSKTRSTSKGGRRSPGKSRSVA
jgi:hypothetical protein